MEHQAARSMFLPSGALFRRNLNLQSVIPEAICLEEVPGTSLGKRAIERNKRKLLVVAKFFSQLLGPTK